MWFIGIRIWFSPVWRKYEYFMNEPVLDSFALERIAHIIVRKFFNIYENATLVECMIRILDMSSTT